MQLTMSNVLEKSRAQVHWSGQWKAQSHSLKAQHSQVSAEHEYSYGQMRTGAIRSALIGWKLFCIVHLRFDLVVGCLIEIVWSLRREMDRHLRDV